MDTFSLDIPIGPTHRPDSVIDQNNHDLAVRVRETDSDANSVQENLDTGFDDDDQESEVEQNIKVDDVDRPFENQGVAYEHEAVHKHDEPNENQGVVHDINDQDDVQITELNTVDVDTQIHESQHNSNQITESSTEDETSLRSETEGIVDVGVGLIEREEGVVYNLRNRHMLRALMQLLEVMDNPHSTKAYETPMDLFQAVLDHATGNDVCKKECIDKKI